jgi:hypothetical protein
MYIADNGNVLYLAVFFALLLVLIQAIYLTDRWRRQKKMISSFIKYCGNNSNASAIFLDDVDYAVITIARAGGLERLEKELVRQFMNGDKNLNHAFLNALYRLYNAYGKKNLVLTAAGSAFTDLKKETQVVLLINLLCELKKERPEYADSNFLQQYQVPDKLFRCLLEGPGFIKRISVQLLYLAKWKPDTEQKRAIVTLLKENLPENSHGWIMKLLMADAPEVQMPEDYLLKWMEDIENSVIGGTNQHYQPAININEAVYATILGSYAGATPELKMIIAYELCSAGVIDKRFNDFLLQMAFDKETATAKREKAVIHVVLSRDESITGAVIDQFLEGDEADMVTAFLILVGLMREGIVIDEKELKERDGKHATYLANIYGRLRANNTGEESREQEEEYKHFVLKHLLRQFLKQRVYAVRGKDSTGKPASYIILARSNVLADFLAKKPGDGYDLVNYGILLASERGEGFSPKTKSFFSNELGININD